MEAIRTGEIIIKMILALNPGGKLAADGYNLFKYFQLCHNPEKGETARSEMNKFLDSLRPLNVNYIYDQTRDDYLFIKMLK